MPSAAISRLQPGYRRSRLVALQSKKAHPCKSVSEVDEVRVLTADQQSLLNRRRPLGPGIRIGPIGEIERSGSSNSLPLEILKRARVDHAQLGNEIDVGASAQRVRDGVSAMIALAADEIRQRVALHSTRDDRSRRCVFPFAEAPRRNQALSLYVEQIMKVAVLRFHDVILR